MVRTAARKILNESSASESEEQSQSKRRTSSRNRKQQEPTRKMQDSAKKQPEPLQKQKMPPVLRDIIRLQSNTNRLIPRAPFGRLLKEIMQSFGDFKITKGAFDALQEAFEVYIVSLLEDSYKLTLHRGRITLDPRDIRLLLYLRGSLDPGSN